MSVYKSTAVLNYLARVQSYVRRALRVGVLVKPDTCEECGIVKRLEAAHRDYARPLDVRWLCRPCHLRWDRADPKIGSLLAILEAHNGKPPRLPYMRSPSVSRERPTCRNGHDVATYSRVQRRGKGTIRHCLACARPVLRKAYKKYQAKKRASL